MERNNLIYHYNISWGKSGSIMDYDVVGVK